jgi:hypothetical protein
MASQTGETAQTSGLDVEQALHHVQIDLDDLGVRRQRITDGDPGTKSLVARDAGLSLAAECRSAPADASPRDRAPLLWVIRGLMPRKKRASKLLNFREAVTASEGDRRPKKMTPWRRAMF